MLSPQCMLKLTAGDEQRDVITVALNGMDPVAYMATAATLLKFPYRLGFSTLKGSLYVADYMNKAIRRFFVLPIWCADAQLSPYYPQKWA